MPERSGALPEPSATVASPGTAVVSGDAASSPVPAATPPATPRGQGVRTAIAAVLVVALVGAAYAIHGSERAPGGGVASDAAFLLLVGLALGVVFERGRFCFFCITRDFAERRDPGGLFAILAALAVGALGYAIVLSVFVPDPSQGALPPGAHIGPVTPVLALAGLVFGIGMVLSHGCIGGHLYRLAQGSLRSVIALLGALVGFGAGYATWNQLYLGMIGNSAPQTWLPTRWGYGGALLVTVAVLGAIALLLARWAQPAAGGGVRPRGWRGWHRALIVERWPAGITGALVGIIGVVSYLKVAPLGVTAQWGSISRTLLDERGALPDTLYGLDAFAGCATVVAATIIDNGWLISGLVAGAFAAALAGGRVRFEPVGPTGAAASLLGGVLLGWGAMSALGCTFGVLLSGTQAFALSGWVFAATFGLGAALAFRLRLQDL